MSQQLMPRAGSERDELLSLLRCPIKGGCLVRQSQALISESGQYSYRSHDDLIPLFAEKLCSDKTRVRGAHSEKIAPVIALLVPFLASFMTGANVDLAGGAEGYV